MKIYENSSLVMDGFAVVYQQQSLKPMLTDLGNFWKNFCAQDIIDKGRFNLSPEGGYGHEPGTNGFKEKFQISLRYNPEKYSLTPGDKQFMKSALDVIDECEPLVFYLSSLISREAQKDFMRLLSKRDLWKLRLSHHAPSKQEVFRSPRIEESPLVINLWESSPGLQVFWENSWMTLNSSDGRSGYFAGLLGQYHSECLFQGLLNRVASTEHSREHGWSSIDLVLDVDYPMQYYEGKFGPAHKRFVRGANYEMEFEVFEQYFREAFDTSQDF